MADVYDRWHLSRPRPAALPCEHGTAKSPKYPSADHGTGRRWQVRYRDSNGRQRKENFEKKATADTRANSVGAELDRGAYVDPSTAKITFRTYTEDWRSTRVHDVVTAGRIERQMRLHVYPVLGDRTMRELAARPSLCQTWIAGLDMAPSSANQVINDVSAVFTAAAVDGLISRNPIRTSSVRKPTVTKVRPEPWSIEQLVSMTEALAGRPGTARWSVVPDLGTGTGGRQGELFGLDVDESLDFLRRAVHIVRQVRLVGTTPVFAPVKNNKPHDAPLPDSLALSLAKHIERYPPVPVTLPWKVPDGKPVTYRLLLSTAEGQAVTRDRFNRVWHAALKRAGIPVTRRNGMHVLRHTAASTWLEGGVSITTVADALGDTVATVSNTYAHKLPAGPELARKVMNEFLSRTRSALGVPSRESS
jgi:integrase